MIFMEYLVLWDIDWTMYPELPACVEGRLLGSAIEDIKEGEFASCLAKGLEQAMQATEAERQGIVSNGISDEQRKKIKGFGIEKYVNPELILISHEMAQADLEQNIDRWDFANAEYLHKMRNLRRCIDAAQAMPEYRHIEKWDKPSSLMIEVAAGRFVDYALRTGKKIELPRENVFYIGDREKDMKAVTSYGGRGIHVRSRNNDSLESIPEEVRKKHITCIEYSDYPWINEIVLGLLRGC
jgi:phosphoglycolate phosphatase-like HAD superfamily hydrolase